MKEIDTDEIRTSYEGEDSEKRLKKMHSIHAKNTVFIYVHSHSYHCFVSNEAAALPDPP